MEASKTPRWVVGLTWSGEVDLDLMAFGCDYDQSGIQKLVDDQYFVFRNNVASPCGGISFSGDETQDGKEEIIIDVAKLDPLVKEVVIVAYVYGGNGNFGSVPDGFITVNGVRNLNLAEDYPAFEAVKFGSIYQEGDQWVLEVSGDALDGGPQDVLKSYHRMPETV